MITGKVTIFYISLKGGAICSLISVLNIFRFGIKVTGNFIQVTSPHYAYLTYIVCCAFDPESNRIVLCTKWLIIIWVVKFSLNSFKRFTFLACVNFADTCRLMVLPVMLSELRAPLSLGVPTTTTFLNFKNGWILAKEYQISYHQRFHSSIINDLIFAD